jgi:1-acyl-sn-glycerol-3-phosphate acyltransferase
MWLRYIVLRPFFLLLAKTKKYGLQYTGADNAPIRGPLIAISNHQTEVDGFAIALALHKTLNRTPIVPWAKVEIGRGLEGKTGWVLWRIFDKITIDRGMEQEAAGAIKQSLDHLRKGAVVLVFPEGTRYPWGQLGSFKYGVANLARSAPAPILPVALWRREEDGGVQVNIGKPFFMPNKKRPLKVLAELEEKADDRFSHRIDVLKQWSEGITRDRKGMKMIANMISLIVQNIEKQDISLEVFCKMAEADDNRFLQEKILELLPEGWERAPEGT